MNNLQICKQTRKIASDSLAVVLKKVLATNEPISEAQFRDLWLNEMRKSPSIFPDGWYDPPPHGIIVLFASDKDVSRTHYQSARPEPFWPRDDIFLDKQNGIILLYSSPVDRSNGIIGDFELTLYLGSNKEIQDHIKSYASLYQQIYDWVKIGTNSAGIAQFTQKLFDKHNLVNSVLSITGHTGLNLGHSIPFIDRDLTEEEKKILTGNDWSLICNLISRNRKFVDLTESQAKIKPNFAFTIEPRALSKKNSQLPLVMFHTICLIDKKGKKELLSGFDDIFKICGMEFMSG